MWIKLPCTRYVGKRAILGTDRAKMNRNQPWSRPYRGVDLYKTCCPPARSVISSSSLSYAPVESGLCLMDVAVLYIRTRHVLRYTRLHNIFPLTYQSLTEVVLVRAVNIWRPYPYWWCCTIRMTKGRSESTKHTVQEQKWRSTPVRGRSANMSVQFSEDCTTEKTIHVPHTIHSPCFSTYRIDI